MINLGQNHPFERAWHDNFGEGAGFEERWRGYWLGLHDNPTADLYAKATAATITSFVARAAAQHQTFDSFDELVRVAKQGGVKVAIEQWLPRKLLDDALADAQDLTKSRGAQWSIIPGAPKKPPQMLCRLGDGTRIVGRFALRNGRAQDVTAEMAK